MKTAPLILSAGAFACLAGVPAGGQRLPISDWHAKKIEGDPIPLADARRMVAEFATCVVKRHRKRAEALTLDSGWSHKEDWEALADANCLNPAAERLKKVVQLELPPDILGYAVGEALLRSEVPSFSRAFVDNAAPLGHPTLEAAKLPVPNKNDAPERLAAIERAREENLAKIAFGQFGECVSRADPQASYNLTTTLPSSPEESAAVEALRPAMAACVRDGAGFKSNKAMIRGVIATSLYRLIKAPRVPQAEVARR